jgi:hypothetical protein
MDAPLRLQIKRHFNPVFRQNVTTAIFKLRTVLSTKSRIDKSKEKYILYEIYYILYKIAEYVKGLK